MPSPPLVYVHAYAPPYPGGTPVILRRVLGALAPIRVVTVTDHYVSRHYGAAPGRIPGPYRWVTRMPPWGSRWLAGRIAGVAANTVLAVAAGVYAGLLARRHRAGWVLSVVDEGFSVIAGHVASRVGGAPHLVWVFDLWQENAYRDVDRWLAALVERRILQGAAAVISHAEEMSDFYERKHGVRCFVLPTPIDIPPEEREAVPPASGEAAGRQLEVLYAGALYWAQEEAVRRLARVCRSLDGVRLTVVGHEHAVRAAGIEADAVEAPTSPEAFRARVRGADVAFLGLAFDSPHPEVIATATPARLPEYMASGTPLLVHAPGGSHVAEYARREDFAEVVDVPDDDALAEGLRRVAGDPALSNMRARRARAIALERHDAERVRDRLRRLLESLRRPSR
jgi:glycosyltransferase involved in cell wall biosynthesis